MKKKILSIAVMALTIATLLAVSVFADAEITSDKTEIYNNGSNNTAVLTLTPDTDKTIDKATITWSISTGSDSISITPNEEKCTVTGKGEVDKTEVVTAVFKYSEEGSGYITVSKEIKVKKLTIISAEVINFPSKYTVGQAVKKDDFTVKVTYNDGTSDNNYTKFTTDISVAEKTTTKVVLTVEGYATKLEVPVTVEEMDLADFVDSITITHPNGGKAYSAGDTIRLSDIILTVTYRGNLPTSQINAAADGVEVTGTALNSTNTRYTFTKNDEGKTIIISVKYYGKTADVSVTVQAKPEDTKRITNLTDGYVVITDTRNNTYIKGDSYNPNGLNVPLYYSDGSSKTITLANISSIKLDAVSNNCTVTVANVSDGGTLKFNLKINGIKVEDAIDITGLSNDDEDYELDEKYKLEIGDTLEWEDFFKEVTIKYKDGSKTKHKTIEDEDDLERYFPGAKLRLEVYKYRGEKDADIVEETNASGEVELILYIEYAGKNLYSSSSQYIRFTAKVQEEGVGVRIYSSSTSTSSTYLEGTKYFDDLEEALDALEEYDEDDEDDFEDTFGTGLSSKYVIYITINENQKLGKSYSFNPGFENKIAVDLKGNELSLPSDWIEYDRDNEDLSVIIANSDTKNDGKLEYNDKDVVIPISSSDKLEFAKDKIPGFYKFKVDVLTNGTASVKVDDKKLSKLPQASALEVVKGSKLSITVTPDKGYKISSVKNGSSSVSAKEIVDETAKSALYEITVKDDVELKITFAKDTSASTSTSTGTTTKPAGPTADEVINGWTNKFTDISRSDSYYNDVAYACASGYFNGTDSTKFSPKGEMTRAMFVTALGRLYEKTNNANIKTNSKYAKSTFSDVSASDASISYAIPYIQWAVEQSITNGVGNNKFDPKAPITHAQMYTFMYRYAQSQMVNLKYSGTEITVADKNDIPTWSGAENAVKFATYTQTLIKDSSGRITPNSNAYRWELATIISKYAQNIKSWQTAN